MSMSEGMTRLEQIDAKYNAEITQVGARRSCSILLSQRRNAEVVEPVLRSPPRAKARLVLKPAPNGRGYRKLSVL
jgi:hypothetical protein